MLQTITIFFPLLFFPLSRAIDQCAEIETDEITIRTSGLEYIQRSYEKEHADEQDF